MAEPHGERGIDANLIMAGDEMFTMDDDELKAMQLAMMARPVSSS